jgi:hypothetical protein
MPCVNWGINSLLSALGCPKSRRRVGNGWRGIFQVTFWYFVMGNNLYVKNNNKGCFSDIVCTGMFSESENESGRVIITKQTKAEVSYSLLTGRLSLKKNKKVCHSINAQLLIDDSIEHALHCSSQCRSSGTPPTPVLLFGDYEWNKRRSMETEQTDEMCFEARSRAAGGGEFWKEDEAKDRALTEGAEIPIWRTKDWSAVVEWVRNAKKEGRL